MTILETERLVIRQFSLADAPFMLRLLNSPGWLEHIGDRGVRDLSGAESYLLNGNLKDYEEKGFGFYALVLKSDGQLIGTAGITQRDFLEVPDIGFALMPGYEGQGLASEASQAILQYARQKLRLSRLIAVTSPTNIRSQLLLEKLGLRFEKEIIWPKSKEIIWQYGITFL